MLSHQVLTSQESSAGPWSASFLNSALSPSYIREVLCVCVCVCGLVMSDSGTPWTVAHQAPLSVGFSREEYWSG